MKMKITLEMDIPDFDFLIKRFKLKREFNRTIDACIETGIVMDSDEMIKDIRHHFIDKQFMKKIEDVFGDTTVSIILNEGE